MYFYGRMRWAFPMAVPGRPVPSGEGVRRMRHGRFTFGGPRVRERRAGAWVLVSVVLVATLATIATFSLSFLTEPAIGNGRSLGNAPEFTSARPAAPATVTPTPSSGRVGSNVTVTGSGFTDNTALKLYFNGTPSDSGALPTSCSSGPAGGFNCVVQVPALSAGYYDLNVTDEVNHGTAGFTILSPTLTLFPTAGLVTSNSTANGSGFKPSNAVTLMFNGTTISSCASETSLVANTWGNFSCRFAVPAYPAGKFNQVNATDAINSARAFYTIDRPTVALHPTSGDIGSAVTLTGAGFAPTAVLTLTFGTTTISTCSPGSASSNSFGDLSCSFPAPVLKAGTYLVNASDSVNAALPASFTIGPPFLSLSVTQGKVGISTTATGSGFTPSAHVSLVYNSTPISSCTSGQLVTSSSGGFSCAFAVPASTSGSQTVSANDSVNTAVAGFDVTASLALGQANGSFNEVVSATGAGFDPDASVAVSWNSSYVLCTAETDADGSFSCSFDVPTAPAGSDTVTATEGRNAPTALFVVDPTMVLSSTSRVVGQPEIASGYGFGPFLAVSVLWDHLTPECSGSSTNSNGAVTCPFLVPPAPGGEHNVTLAQGAFEVNRSLTVTAAFSINPTAGVVGLSVELIGTGFQASTEYFACLETSLTSCPSSSPSFVTDSNGSIPPDTNFTIPQESPGSYELVVSSETSIAGGAVFVVTTASVDLTPTSGPVGTSLSLSGGGYTPNMAYAYCFQATFVSCPSSTLTTFTSTSSGAIPSGVLLTVPASPVGAYYLDVSLGTSLIALGEFVVVSNVTGNVTTATVGSLVVADGTGFPADATFELGWNSSVPLCAGTTNSTGGFTCSFAVPPAFAGAHKVSATSESNTATFTLSILPALTVSPGSATVGTTVRVVGTGFDADAAYSVLWNGSIVVSSGWTNGSGSLASSFAVPGAPAGARPISVVESSHNVTVELSVIPSLAATPLSGVVGSVALVTGAGLDAKTSYDLLWNISTTLCSGTTNGTGGFACAFSVPVAPGGPNTIEAVEGSNSPKVVFTVTPSVGIAPSEGQVGSRELAEATGFAAAAAYVFWWNSSAKLCSGSANSNGEFDCSFTVPTAPAGVYNLTAVEGGSSLSVPLTIVPTFLVSVTTGNVSTPVRVSGSGFDADSSFGLAWNSTTQVCAGTTTSSGNLSCAFQVPNSPGGPHTLVLTEGSHSLMTSFTVLPSFSVSQLNATAGASLTVAGEGFAAGEPYAVSMTPTGGTVCSGTADGNGAFECTFLVPSVPAGMYTIAVNQGATALSLPFFVTTPVSPPASSTPFPWWLVALVAAAAIVGVLAILLQSRRQASARGRGRGPSNGAVVRTETPGGRGPAPPSTSPVASTSGAIPPPASYEPEGTPKRLGRPIGPVPGESPKAPELPGSSETAVATTKKSSYDVDALVARFGPIYHDALTGQLPPGSYAGTFPRTPPSAEEVRTHLVHLVPVYRRLLDQRPPEKPT